MNSSPLAVAHRAGNSLAGLRGANELGVDVIECDVHEYRGRLEVRHLKTAGPLPFLWDRWELASASAPRLGLDELLAAGTGATFMLDLKGRRTAAARAVTELLHESGHDQPLLVCGRYWPAVDELAQLPYVRPVLSARNRVELARLLTRIRGGSVHGVSVHRSLLDSTVVASMLDHVEVVMTWPINDLASLEGTLAIGVNAVISDEPSVLAALLAAR
ncbi:glycerophosphodiester phosphodiesterase [Nocardioides piscis]|uniref:Glycerophosphodiester phosphodiesterase n=1 Tax=Nocardioides piscis TaxID=2714938 RepID=A0A6G7YIP2_9ACTN|nr:glycerophosphodiester phosphodiesterase [Nocardioides piscis]QIK76614.1 glycerophosphodiester phosphodiesterase [Nocardioides piscis]